jgi:hypothetical protein
MGWDLAQALSDTGYSGKIAYIGLTWIPEKINETIFDVKMEKFPTQNIIQYARKTFGLNQ